MQVILLEKVINLGSLGDVVKVRQGFARNFLIPQGKAKRATETAVKEFETRRAELEKAQAEKLTLAQTLGEKLKDVTLTMTAKAGVDGRLFGSVTNLDISQALAKLGFTIAKANIHMPHGSFKAIGEYSVTIALHTDVTVDVAVKIQPQAE